MADHTVDVEQALSDVARVVPIAATTEKAMAAVRAALETHSKRRKRWILPVSLAAGLLLVAALAISTLQRPASAAEELATTLKANQAYRGWVHMSFDAGADRGGLTVSHWNTETGAAAGSSKGGASLYFQDPKTSVFQDYHAAARLVRIGTLSPDKGVSLRESAAVTPLTYQDLLDEATLLLGKDEVKVTESSERGMKRFDLHAMHPTRTEPGGEWKGHLGFPSVIWVDPASRLIREALVVRDRLTLTYGGPEIASVYDLGAPRDAETYDNRPTPATIAVCDRVSARMNRPLPDGVSVFLWKRENGPVEMQVHGDSGNKWIHRFYAFDQKGATSLKLPEDWTQSGADEFFRRLETTWLHDEFSGDGETARYENIEKPSENEHFTGRTAITIGRSYSPTRRLYPADAFPARFGTDNHVDLLTSADRPGLIALHLQLHGKTPDEVRADYQYWIDPARDDRPVIYLQTSYDETDGVISKDVAWKVRTEFGAYATLPAPDGRSYPTRWTRTTDFVGLNKDGKPAPSVHEDVTFHFFPGKTLSPLPKKATTQP